MKPHPDPTPNLTTNQRAAPAVAVPDDVERKTRKTERPHTGHAGSR